MPEAVKQNPLFAKIWNSIYEQQMSATILVLGNVGKGKSTLSIFMADILDPTFTADRICFSVEEILKLISEGNLKRGSAIILDEAAGSEEAADSRNAMSKTNKTISYFTTISRQLGLIIFYVAPMLSQLDKRLRLVGVSCVIVAKKIDRQRMVNITDFYWVHLSPLTGKVYMTKPRQFIDGRVTILSPVLFPYPKNAELITAYRKKKDEFIKSSISRWYGQLVERKANANKPRQLDYVGLAKTIELDKKSFMQGKKVSIALICAKLGLGRNAAGKVRDLVGITKKM